MKYIFTAILTETYEVSFDLRDRDWKPGDEGIDMESVVIGIMHGDEKIAGQFPNTTVELVDEVEEISVKGPIYDREN